MRLRTPITAKWTLATLLLALAMAAPAPAKDYTYGVEINGVLCGYAEVEVSKKAEAGRMYILVEQRIFAMLSALGSEVNQEIEFTYHVDPLTWQFTYHDSHIKQGDLEISATVHVEEGHARCNSTLTSEETLVPLAPDTILANPLYMNYLERDFADGTTTERTYRMFEPMDQAVQTVTFTRVGTEPVELAGRTYEAVIFDELNQDTGVKLRVWLDAEDYFVLKVVLPNRRNVYLADPSIKKRIELVSVDENILVRTNVSIPDVQGIAAMKVKAVIEPTGQWLTPADLDVPGQRFTGTVTENLIEGVFEIEHRRYDGANAPPFPVPYAADESLAEYLVPQEFIESDDPVLVERARELTLGAEDSWDAARRLSRWVAENIDYAIPGGGTSRRTYDLRAGECGAHSILLAAFCRAVGIPARVVWGCMYVPNFGGAFGQHAWTEIHMGDAGWIPVDATAYETDFVDSGHVRIGVYESFATSLNAKSMEVLDYRTAEGETTAASSADLEAKYAAHLGAYDTPGGGEPFVVRIQDGGLVVEIPGRAVLPFHEPDEDGRWSCTLAPKLYCTFRRDDGDRVVEMTLHELVRMQRRTETDPAEIAGDVPEALRRYLGVYYLAALQAEFVVLWHDGKLAVHNPLEDRIVHLRPTGVEGRWIDEFDKNAISFKADDDGTVTTLVLDVANGFRRRMADE